MAFINMVLVDAAFHISFGRNEQLVYKLMLSPIAAQVGPYSVAAVAREGIIKQTTLHDESNVPLYIGNIDVPMGDTATLDEIVDFYNDIVDNANVKEYPTIILALPKLAVSTADNGSTGLLVIQESEGPRVFASLSNKVDLQDRLSCTKHVNIHGIDPMIGSMVDHLHFAQQIISAMSLLTNPAAAATQESVVQALMEEFDEESPY